MIATEKVVFPVTSVLAETGGTLGLILGLSILEIMSSIWIGKLENHKFYKKKI